MKDTVYIEELHTLLKNNISKINLDYDSELKTIAITKDCIEKEISAYNISPVKSGDIYKMKNIFLISCYILKRYLPHCGFLNDFYQSNADSIKELKYLYNNGDFLNEKEFNNFKYYKWINSDNSKEINNKLFIHKVFLNFIIFAGPIIIPSLFSSISNVCNNESFGFLGNLFAWFMISAFASPILFPIEILLARLYCNALDNKYYTSIEQHFNIKIDHSTKAGDIATGALALKTHLSLKNAWKKGDWIEK